MEKFTKGDWVPCIRNDDQLQTTFFGVVMNRVYLQIGSGNENRMNANLIAAAPEMYDLLSTIENDSNQVPEWLWQKIQKTLAKARCEL